MIEGHIDVGVLMSFALIHCDSSKGDVAKIFYQMLKEGEIDENAVIANDDKYF